MSDHDEIAETVFDYFQGYRTKDRALLERAFATGVAQMIGYRKQEGGSPVLSARPITQVIDAWVAPDYQPLPVGPGEILAIHKFSEVGASVVFDFGGIFLDEFQMVKLDGRWRIANKFFVDKA